MNRILAFVAAVALSGATLAAAPAFAQMANDQMAVEQQGTSSITVAKDKSAAFRLDYPASEIVVAAPETLALVATTDRSFYVRGKQIGVTNILIYDAQHRLAQVVDVRVGYDTESLQADLAAALPGEPIKVSNFAGGLLLTGEVSTSNVALRAAAVAERYAPKAVQSALTVRAAQQVMVEVRIIEASRSALKDLGIGWSVQNLSGFTLNTSSTLLNNSTPTGQLDVGGHFGPWSVDATIKALEQKGSVHTLARPNLTAMSGQEASFLAGGEFPFPVPNGNNGVTIEFRTFGVKLNVTPTVEDSGQIRLKVAPEVSQLDPGNGVTIQGFKVPAISTRRAATDVELRDGQSFAVAGLFERGQTRAVNQVPWAGDVPVLGALFKSADWQKSETELVIIVTPHLTTPTDHIESLPNPLRDDNDPSPIDLILAGKGVDMPKSEPAPAGQPAAPVAMAEPAAPGPVASAEPAEVPMQTAPAEAAPAGLPAAGQP
ncbi:MAG: type II and III secretion system protein family protein [Proteobacteria bacterium]|nr:type II and III secretion system protein family protein [Pseudomonadota bacterium]